MPGELDLPEVPRHATGNLLSHPLAEDGEHAANGEPEQRALAGEALFCRGPPALEVQACNSNAFRVSETDSATTTRLESVTVLPFHLL